MAVTLIATVNTHNPQAGALPVNKYVVLSSDTKPTNCGAGSLAWESDTGKTSEYTGSTWQYVSTSGAGHVTVRDSSPNLVSSAAGQNLTINASSGADTLSAVIGATSFILTITGASIADGVRVAQGSAPTTSATSPILIPGTHGPFASATDDKIAVRSNDAGTGVAHIIPLA